MIVPVSHAVRTLPRHSPTCIGGANSTWLAIRIGKSVVLRLFGRFQQGTKLRFIA